MSLGELVLVKIEGEVGVYEECGQRENEEMADERNEMVAYPFEEEPYHSRAS